MNAEARKKAKEERRKKWANIASNNGEKASTKRKEDLPEVVWRKLSSDAEGEEEDLTPLSEVPLILLTVDSPSYRARCDETRQHLRQWQESCSCTQDKNSCTSISTESCDMLNLQDHPNVGTKRIVFEGWRRVFLPQLLVSRPQSTVHFCFAAEDDIRIPDSVTPCSLVNICQQAFHSYPNLDVLSLGHSWKAVQKTTKRKPQDDANRNLLHYLQSAKGAGVHGATLFAIRLPRGVHQLQQALDQAARGCKQTHFDQFLFYSPHHNLQIALCDPPLVGWAEVETTLTKSSSGHRRQGGGRWGYLPTPSSNNEQNERPVLVAWIQRQLSETTNPSS